MPNQIKRAYIRRYSDTGQTFAYIEWANGSRTEGTAHSIQRRMGTPIIFSFGTHMHALFVRAKREGTPLTRETW